MRRLILLALLLGSLAPGQPAVAQSPDATPSARELWDTYPLEATPEPGADPVGATPTAAATPRPAEPAQSSGSGTSTVVAVMLLLVAFVVGFALAIRPPARLSRRAPQPSPEPAPATPSASRPPLEPPARGRPWSAEIEWHTAAGEGRLRAVARAADGREEAILAESPAVEWPPSSDTSLPTLTTAAEELERRLIGAGWRPLPPGDTWYAKRFTWDPALWTSRRRFEHRQTTAARRRG